MEEKNNELLKIEITLKDPRAIEIFKRLPPDKKDEIIEKYIILGDTVILYASVVPSEDYIQKFFKTSIEELGKIPETIKNNLSGIAEELKGVIVSYREMLSKIIPSLGKGVERGAIACNTVFTELQNVFVDDQFEDVSTKERYTDILGTPTFATNPILIEVKDHSNPVPSDEVDKFWRDMEERNALVGCFFSLRTSIRNTTEDFKIVSKGGSLGIFVVNEAFNNRGHIFGYMVARKILEVQSKLPTVGKEKYALIARILNNRLKDLKNAEDEFEVVKQKLREAKEKVNSTLDSAVEKVSSLHGRIHQIIESTFKDLSGEVESPQHPPS